MESKLLPYELHLIKREKLESFYKELIRAAVNPFRPFHLCLILKLSLATLGVEGRDRRELVLLHHENGECFTWV